jgi:protein ImuA
MSHADAIPLPANDAAIACLHGARTGDLSLGNSHDEWSPQLELPRSLWEIFSSADDAAGEALALAFARTHRRHIDQDGIDQDGAWLWVQDASSIRRGGRPYLHGLPAEQRSNLIHVAARNAADALWAMEEGVRCGALSFVIGEIAGDPKALDFTASRRLVLAAERHGVPLYLVRREGYANLSAARLRWRVRPAPSSEQSWNATAPGLPRVSAELFRGRGVRPGLFTLTHGIGGQEGYGHEPGHRLDLVPELRDRSLESQHRQAG